MTGEPDFIKANKKISKATEWRGDVNISLGDETVTFSHRLLDEDEFLELNQVLNLSEIDQPDEPGENVGETEAQERLLELQQKEELTEEEKDELSDLTDQVVEQTDQIEKALGSEGYDKLMELGRETIMPSKEDIDYFYDNPTELNKHTDIGDLPNPLTRGVIEDALKAGLERMVTDQPYPIKLNVGMQAFSETMSVLGNGLQS